DIGDLRLHYIASLELRSGRHFTSRNDCFYAVGNANERTVVSRGQNRDLLADSSRHEVVEQRSPGVIVELTNAQADLLLVMVDREDDGFDIVALLINISGVVDLDGPAEVGLVNHTVNAIFDSDEYAVVSDGANLAANFVAGLVGIREGCPGIGLKLLHTQAAALGAGVDLENRARHFMTAFAHLRRLVGLFA